MNNMRNKMAQTVHRGDNETHRVDLVQHASPEQKQGLQQQENMTWTAHEATTKRTEWTSSNTRAQSKSSGYNNKKT
jgi:hypothetical protein